jgi:uncharacterized protein YjiS (DUF1127 family)
MPTLPLVAAAPPPRLSALARLLLWLSLGRERGDLAALDERMLRDVGLDPATARREWTRPFWDIPPSRLL